VRRRGIIKDLARQRIKRLFDLALKKYKDELDLANRYVEIALKISRKVRVRIPREYRLLYCRKCGSLLIPGRTSLVRVRNYRERHLSIKCLNCGRIIRKPLK